MITFAIGDVHGCLSQLKALFGKINVYRADHNISDADTRIVFVGDYIDRGPDSRGVIQTIMNMQKASREDDSSPGLVALKGNHEDMLLNNINGFLGNGGIETLKSYGWNGGPDISGYIPADHLEWIKNLPLYFDDGKRFFVHAGVYPDDDLNPPKSSPQAMMWIRQEFLGSKFVWPRLIVHGHTPRGVEILPNRINIDSACVFGDALTCAIFNDEQIRPLEYLQVEGYKNTVEFERNQGV